MHWPFETTCLPHQVVQPLGSICESREPLVATEEGRVRSLVQFHHLGEPLQQQCPCLLDGSLYDLSGTWEIMNHPHALPTPQRQVVRVALHRGFSVNVTGIDIMPGEWQHGRASASVGVGEGVAERACEPSLRTSVRVVALAERSSRAFLCDSGAMDSRVATKRVPIKMPLAPSARAPTNPRPSAIPPAAITGIRTASTTSGTSATVPIVPTSQRLALESVTDVHQLQPLRHYGIQTGSLHARASSTVVTIAIIFIPWR